MAPSATDVVRTPLCPALAPDLAGVRIAVAPRPQRSSPLVIHGSYRIPWADADSIEPSRHRALVLVVTAGAGHLVSSPFRERVLFPDDEQETRGGALGHFTIDVFEQLGREAAGDYHLLVSLGPYTSNIERVQVQ